MVGGLASSIASVWQKVRGRAARPNVVTLVVRNGCHLCEEALPLVESAALAAGVAFECVDTDQAPAYSQWTAHVPVVLIDGEQFSYWFVDEEALRNALQGGHQ